jgi:hypothetical protein
MLSVKRSARSRPGPRPRSLGVRVAVLAVAGGLALGTFPGAAASASAHRIRPAVDSAPAAVAYAYANQASTHAYVPEKDYSYNSSGKGIHIVNSAVGVYTVEFSGLGAYASGGTVDVTAEGLNADDPYAAECEVSSWGASKTGANLLIGVVCDSLSGARLDGYFEVAFTSGGSTGGTNDYVWANEPGTSSYTPDLARQFNSSGGTNTIQRLAAGEYEVSLPGTDAVDGTVKVTPYGTASDSCQVGEWDAVSTGQDVLVECFNAAGNPTDDEFTMTFTASNDLMGDGNPSGYLWANDPTTTQTYTPDTLYQWDTAGSSAQVIPFSGSGGPPGGWENVWPNDGQGDTGDQQASAYGSTLAHCIVDGPSGGTGAGAQEQGDVFCFDNSGNPLDTYYTTQWWVK